MSDRYTDVEDKMDPMDGDQGTLEADVGPEIYHELLTEFLSHLVVQVTELRAAAADFDVPRAQSVAHQIKGTAGSFGAVGLDRLSKRMLQMDAAQLDLLQTLVDEIEAEVAAFRSSASEPAPT
jgi:HPt (histidine-containing phosphotransfer) domain-containing protein